ncbi:hypothetical protein B9T65_00045 [Serratia marcescens]|nr:hypothetical protein AR325_24025 [Serratia marcescens]PHI54206.1 hypothetical protein B9T65_00045 [Serratia marcescens]
MQGSLKAGDVVVFYVPPRWEGTSRPAILASVAGKLLENNIRVKFVESEKPVYGYLDKKTGGSDDASILERISLHPLRNAQRNEKNKFLSHYFEVKTLQSGLSSIGDYQSSDSVDDLLRMSANRLVEDLISQYGKDNIKVLSDMDPALQKASHNHGIEGGNRLDQQNHAILLDATNQNINLEMKKAVLAKVLGGRGENISHIGLGGKNTLKGTLSILNELSITGSNTIAEVKNIITEKVLSHAMNAEEAETEFNKSGFSGVLKGNTVTNAGSVEKTVYIYAHKKMPIIGKHILSKIKSGDPDYSNKMFIFCGANAVGKLNAMHLAYLMDADGITTSGAGTSGEFVYLHKVAGARSNLLSLPIEGHNEQEAITDALFQYPSTKDNMFRLGEGEALEEGRTIDALVKKKAATAGDHVETYQKFISALSDSQTYVGQAHDILFNQTTLNQEAEEYQKIQKMMYQSANLKGTRRYLKMVFQMFNYLTASSDAFPMTIKFKESSPGITFHSLAEAITLLEDDYKLADSLGLTNSEAAASLPLISSVRQLICSRTDFSTHEGKSAFEKLKERFGHHMTTGF